MAVLVVVVVEELFVLGLGVVEGVEVVGLCGVVFECLEVCFDVGVVVGDVWLVVGVGDVEVFEELGDGFGCY